MAATPRPQNLFAGENWAAERRQPITPTLFFTESGQATSRAFQTLPELADFLVEQAISLTLMAPRPSIFDFSDFETIQGFAIYTDDGAMFGTVAIQRRPASELTLAIMAAGERQRARKAGSR